jgi:hypothetical protein
MSTVKQRAWPIVFVFILSGIGLAGFIFWKFSLQALDEEITQKRSSIKLLKVGGGLPPNQEVLDYLSKRTLALESDYKSLVGLLDSSVNDSIGASPQLYFQQRLHDVSRLLEKMASARGIGVPQAIGFPKELPPPESVSRLLVQLALIEDVAKIVMADTASVLSSVKIEDPRPVPKTDEEKNFLIRVPVRIRLSCSVKSLAGMLGSVEGMKPITSLDGVRVRHLAEPLQEMVEVELELSRFLII